MNKTYYTTLTSVVEHEVFTFINPKNGKFLHEDQWSNFRIKYSKNVNDAHHFSSYERAVFHLREYSERLKNFKVCRVIRKMQMNDEIEVINA